MNITGIPTFLNSYSNRLKNNNTGKIKVGKMDKNPTSENISMASEKKNTSSLSDNAVEYIQKMAREGAAEGVYMGKKYADFCRQYKQAYITPDYSKLQFRLTSMLIRMPYTGKNTFCNLFGFSCKMGVGLTQSFISVCDKSGDKILFYDSRHGWIKRPSKAENQFHDEAAAIYMEAYDAARAEMKTKELSDSTAMKNFGFDIKA